MVPKKCEKTESGMALSKLTKRATSFLHRITQEYANSFVVSKI
jgi:hypothetical protein